MRAKEVNENKPAAAFADMVPMQAPSSPANTLPADAAGANEESVKSCCICGLDLAQKKRSRDKSGRYWCEFCQNFDTTRDKADGTIPCPDCACETRPMLMVEQAGMRVCAPCHKIYLAEAEPRRIRKAAVTADPELQIRKLIRKLINSIYGMAAVFVLIPMYHYGMLYVRPKPWVPFQSAMYTLVGAAMVASIVIVIQYIRIAYRKRMRRAKYDRMIQSAANQILAADDESHSMGISESPEPLRRRVERAIARTEACAGEGVTEAGEIIEMLAERGNPEHLIRFLQAQRPNTTDTVARNREIATLSYLHGNFPITTSAINAILLRIANDQEAMTRQALISFRMGELELSKKIFKRVVNMAREKNSELDVAEAYCNLGMLHVMLSEFDDASVRYSQAMQIYDRLHKPEGQADCLLNLGLIGYRTKKTHEVEEQFRKAMAINNRRNRREGLSICCSLLGVILIEKEPPQLRQAERLLNRGLKLNLALGRPGGVAAAYGNLGLVRVKRGDLTGARELFLKAQAIYQRISRPKMMTKIQGMLKTVNEMSAARAARK